MAITDYHARIRDAIAGDLKTASLGCAVATVDDIEDAARLEKPVVVVVCIGPEQSRAELSTNARDGINYPCAVLYVATGTSRGEKTEGPPSITEFRRIVRTRYNNKRLDAVAEVAWCEVVDSGPIVDDKGPLFQVLQTALVVQAIGRFPRS